MIRIGTPDHRGSGALPGHNGGGIGGDIQRRGIAYRDSIGLGGALHVLAAVGLAIVGRKGEGHSALFQFCQAHLAGAVRLSGDGGDLLIAAGPFAAGIGGYLSIGAFQGRGQDRQVVPAHGEGVVGRVCFWIDGHLGDQHKGRTVKDSVSQVFTHSGASFVPMLT